MKSETLRRMAGDPAEFRARLLIEADGQPVPFSEVMETWQNEDFRALDPAWLACIGRGNPVTRNRSYLERCRGAGKTFDEAVSSSFALFGAARPIRGYCGAADRDQSGLLRDAIEKLVVFNPWLKKVLTVEKNAVVNTCPNHPGRGSRLEILSADVATSWGLLPDFIICDELTVWPADGGLWHSLFSAVAKKRRALLLIISNAGVGMNRCWQWDVREAARLNPDRWYFHRLDGLPSWIDPAQLDEQKKMLPAGAFKRVWLNEWLSDLGDVLEEQVVQDAIVLPGPEISPRENCTYIGAFDLGIRHDHTGLAILAVDHAQNKIRLVHTKTWRPPRGGKVSLNAVQSEIVRLHRVFNCKVWRFDPYQGELLCENLTRENIRAEEMVFSGRNLHTMAISLAEVFNRGIVQIYRDETLIRDLNILQVEMKSFGLRLVSSRSPDGGHGDLGTAFVIGITEALHNLKYGCFEPPCSAATEFDPSRFGIQCGAPNDPAAASRQSPRFYRHGVPFVDRNWDGYNRRPFERRL